MSGGRWNASSWLVETFAGPPTILRNSLIARSGVNGFSAVGSFGQSVVIEVSADLRTWLPLQTNTIGIGPLQFSDPQPASAANRFYRLRAP